MMEMEQLRLIAARASRFTERLQGDFVPVSTEKTAVKAAERLEKWAQAVGKGDRKRLQQRLALENLTIEAVTPLLGDVVLADDADLPAWTAVLAEIVAETDTVRACLQNGCRHRALEADKPIPFEEILLPAVNVGRRMLQSQQLPTPQLDKMERYLLSLLSEVARPTLESAFWLRRVEKRPILAIRGQAGLGEPEGEPVRTVYQAFVAELLTADSLWEFFAEFAVLARLIAETVQRWVTVAAEFYGRLARDWSRLENQFQQKLQQLTDIQTGLSDPHNGGRTVYILTFDNQFKLVYKPHGLAIEQAYQELVAWLNSASDGELLSLQTLPLLDCGAYGWVGFVLHKPCQSEAEVERYFERMGMLICLMYLLRGADFHTENIIASGEHPVPIDLEACFYPPTSTIFDLDAGMKPGQPIASVLDSGLLPFGDVRQRRAYDQSYLGNSCDIVGERRHSILDCINTDLMRSVEKEITVDPTAQTHFLFLHKRIQQPHRFVDTIVHGFEKTYLFLRRQRHYLLKANSPLANFQNIPLRFVFRDTQVYFKILGTSLQAVHMREGIDRHIQLEHLARGHTREDKSMRHYGKLLLAELAALAQTDIPFFEVRTSSQSIKTALGDVIQDAFLQSGCDYVGAIFQQMSQADLFRQRYFIEQTLVAKRLSNGAENFHSEVALLVQSRQFATSDALIGASDYLAEAERIAHHLISVAIFDGQEAVWTAVLSDIKNRPAVDLIDDGLYEGQAGIGLFFAALWSVTKTAVYRTFAYAALHDIRQKLKRGQRVYFTNQGLGGADGAGSIAYALTHCATFLNDPSLVADAHKFAARLTPDLITADVELDVFGGAAGTIMSLLPLYRQSQDKMLLATLLTCGAHLVQKQQMTDSGERTWATLEDQMLAGFSHGAAGISLALLKLYEQCPDPAFLRAAKDGIAYEQAIFVPEKSNWPDLRKSKGHYVTTWCHGAPGIALARIAGQKIHNSEAVQADIEVGMRRTETAVLQAKPTQLAHLCCGHFGRAEILQYASCPEQREMGRRLMSTLLQHAKESQGYQLLSSRNSKLIQPGFFQGLAGIGYTLLRQARPNALPLILAWE